MEELKNFRLKLPGKTSEPAAGEKIKAVKFPTRSKLDLIRIKNLYHTFTVYGSINKPNNFASVSAIGLKKMKSFLTGLS